MTCDYSVTVTATAPIDAITAVLSVNGPILVTGIIGEVVAELTSTTATEGLLYFIPPGDASGLSVSSSGFGDAISGGAGGYSSVAAGQRFSFRDPASAVAGPSHGALDFGCSLYVPAGEIAVQFPASGGVSPSGAIKWTLWYRPLDPGAAVAAV